MASNNAVTTVILIRHGERPEPTQTNPDPHLNTDGQKRAQALVHVLGKSGVKAVYTSTFARAKETAQPLLALLPSVTPRRLNDPVAIKNDILSNHTGKTVLVVGHSDTVPGVINQLGGGSFPVIPNNEYDNLFVVTVFAPGAASTTKLKYGRPS